MIHSLWLTFALSLSGAVFAPLEDDSNFIEAQQLYEELEFEQAIFRLQAAALVPGRPAHEQARLFVWMGICYAQSGDVSSARRAFADAVRADIGVALPVTVAPELEELLAAVREVEQEKRKLREVRAASVASASSSPPPSTDNPATTSPPATSSVAEDDRSSLWGGVGMAGAVLASATAAVTAYLTYASFTHAQDPKTTQVDAVASEQNANVALYATGGALGLALIALGVGITGFVWSP